MGQLSFDDLEIWRPVADWEGLYEVSSLGRVRSLPRKTPAGVRGGIILRGYERPDHHIKVELRDGGRHKRHYVHRLVMLAFAGSCPDDMEIRHLNGDGTDNRLSNLAYGTKSQNAVDRLLHGRDRNGRKTHCPRGHEYTPENTYVYNKGVRGHRQCRACKQIRRRERAIAA